MKTVLVRAVLAGMLTLLWIGCSGKDKGSSETELDSKKLAARVGDWTVARATLDSLIKRLPPDKQTEYDTPGGRAELARHLIEEELYYQEAQRLGLEKDEHVQNAMEAFLRQTMISEYFVHHIETLAAPSDEDMHDYYEENLDRYTKQPIVRLQHLFSTDKDKIFEFKRRIDDGEAMTTLVHKYSEDELTKADGGDLGYFNPGGYIRGIGFSEELSDAAFDLPRGVVSDPIKWKKGWSIIRVTDRREAELRTYEEVKEEIRRLLTSRRIDEVKETAFKDLVQKYPVENYMEAEWKLTERTPEELWNLAQNSTDAYRRLRHYQEIVDKYPNSKHAARALFMVGFVNAEELMDYVAADRAFTRVVREYPDSDVANSAKYMLENLKKPNPVFEDDQILGDSKADDD